MPSIRVTRTPDATATQRRRNFIIHNVLRILVTYSIPIVIILLGAGAWLWAFLGGKGLNSAQASDVMNLGSAILAGGIVSMAAVWITQRLAEQQQRLVDRFQISLQSNLTGLDLRNKDMRGIYLSGKDLSFARLRDCSLDNAVLVEAILRSADLTGASIMNATLMDARLEDAYFTGACLDGSNLADANLERATLIGASVRNATLTGASFRGADASGADFRGSVITSKQMSEFQIPPDFT